MTADSPHFHGSLAVYGWYAGWISGDLSVGGLGPVDVGDGGGTVEFSEILDGFFMAKGDVRYGRLGLYGDFIYTGLGNSADGPLGFTSADWNFDAMVFTGALSYQLLDLPSSEVHAMAGFRYWGLDVGLGLTLPGGGGPSASRTLDLFDPVIGVRGRHSLTQRLFLEGTGFIGGPLGDTEFMWDAYAGLGYNFTKHFAASLGYRAMGIDYQRGGTAIDLILQGPLAGLTLKF